MSKLSCWVIRETFHLLQEYDPELQQFFKIRADFASAMPRTVENEQKYAHFLADCVAKEKLLPFDRSALMALIEESARTAEDQQKLSLHAASVGDLLRESHYWALIITKTSNCRSCSSCFSGTRASSWSIARTVYGRYCPRYTVN
jgi:predicted ATP-dependent protease